MRRGALRPGLETTADEVTDYWTQCCRTVNEGVVRVYKQLMDSNRSKTSDLEVKDAASAVATSSARRYGPGVDG